MITVINKVEDFDDIYRILRYVFNSDGYFAVKVGDAIELHHVDMGDVVNNNPYGIRFLNRFYKLTYTTLNTAFKTYSKMLGKAIDNAGVL